MQRNGNHQGAGRESPVALSEVLTTIAEDASRERIGVGDLMDLLGERALGALIFVFALPNALPMPPGTSTVLGAPLLFLTAQLALGRPAWLPEAVARRSIARSDFAAMVRRIAPLLARAERVLRPRLSVLVRPPADRVLGAVCFVLAVILVLPIPMGNIPPAAAICLFAIAILEGDGLPALLGLVVTGVAVLVVWGVLFALFEKLLPFVLNIIMRII